MALALFPLFAFLVLLPISSEAQTVGKVTVGAVLSAVENSSPWISPSGDFAFGFRQLESDKDLFLLAIWYDKIPGKTIVWYQNESGPAPRGSTLRLTADRGLVLNSTRGEQLWTTADSIDGVFDVDSGLMNDTGNFMLFESNSILWQSFNNPTDTMLPSQKLDREVPLFSRRSETNFTEGRFRVVLNSDGNLVLATINLPSGYLNEPFYENGTTGNSNLSSPGLQLLFNESGYLFILRQNNERFPLTPRLNGSANNFYYRVTLDFDGIFTLYSHPKASTGDARWTTLWSVPDNICTAGLVTASSGACGFNSICSINPEKRPTCECPRGYALVDPTDQYGDCMPNFTQTCPAPAEDLYDFDMLINVDWPLSDYDILEPSTEEQCKKSCLQDCMCAVSIFRLGDKCWKKKLPLSNGRVDTGLDGAKAFIKIRKGDIHSPPLGPDFPNQEMRKNQNLIITGSILLGTSVFVNLALIAALCFTLFVIYKKKPSKSNKQSQFESNLQFFTYKELIEATNGFKEELGSGAFGVVYKGAIQMAANVSRTNIAVKKLNGMVRDGDKEFKTEINVIGQTHHKNLVRLLGACKEREQRLLVYEFLSNGTLADFLFGNIKPSWNQRTQIALGIARGLLYLHEECSTQIIHCDIKPQNILLDDYYNARISDFGLAKLLMMDQTQTKTAIRGTKGYVAPEWFRNLPVTVKVDVYSFGVILLETICCRRSVVKEEMDDGEHAVLTYWAYDCYSGGKIEDLVNDDMESINDMENLEKFLMVAFWCIQEDPYRRPTMRKVTQMLEGVIGVPIPPNPSPFSIIE